MTATAAAIDRALVAAGILAPHATHAADAFLSSLKAQGRTKGTIAYYRSILNRFAAGCPRLPGSPAQVDHWLAGLGDVAPETRWDYWQACRAFLQWAESSAN